ncbi:MAG: nucleoside deaminase [Cytophagales bacterium]|nr:nucleoside deaminase [Cytophagales bacterium]
MTHQYYLSLCEQLAAIAQQNGNSPVGCVIVINGEIVAEGIESATSDQNITHHAEMNALQAAREQLGKDLSQATLYSTHEPCVMCAYSIRYHGVHTVVFKNKVTQLGSYSSAFNLLTSDEVPDSWPAKPAVIHIP